MHTREIEMDRVYYLWKHLLLTKCINCTWKSMQSIVAFKQDTELNTRPIKSDNLSLNHTHCQGHHKYAACEMYQSIVNHILGCVGALCCIYCVEVAIKNIRNYQQLLHWAI